MNPLALPFEPEFIPTPLDPGVVPAMVLDSIDYGVVLARSDGQLLFANRRARALLQGAQPMSLVDRQLQVSEVQGASALRSALVAAAHRDLRSLVALGPLAAPQQVAVVPVQPGVALLMFGRSSLCELISLECWAREHALSGAETRVLQRLGTGARPVQIAHEHGVSLTTVRTQIGSIRGKIGVPSIVELLHRIATLPPIVGVVAR